MATRISGALPACKLQQCTRKRRTLVHIFQQKTQTQCPIKPRSPLFQKQEAAKTSFPMPTGRAFPPAARLRWGQVALLRPNTPYLHKPHSRVFGAAPAPITSRSFQELRSFCRNQELTLFSKLLRIKRLKEGKGNVLGLISSRAEAEMALERTLASDIIRNFATDEIQSFTPTRSDVAPIPGLRHRTPQSITQDNPSPAYLGKNFH